MIPSTKCKYRVDTEDERVYCQKRKEYIEQPYKCSKGNCDDCQFPTLANVVLKVGRCDECPFCETKRTIGAGDALDFHCKAVGGRLITGYVEYMSELNPVPIWCPYHI